MKRFAQILVFSALTIYIGLWFLAPQVAPQVAHQITPESAHNSEIKAPETNTAQAHHGHSSLNVQANSNTNHDHSAAEQTLPEELEQYIESQRMPAEDIPLVIHGNGNATAYTGNQWSTVVMAVIDEDGTHRNVERQILPIGTLKVSPQEIQQ